MLQNYLLTMSFCGTRYHGFQVQQNALSVCTVLQDAMQKVLGTRPDVKGCSRTDSGVHALGYCVSFFADTPLALQKMPLAINAHLPRDIRVLRAQTAPPDFHARYSAVAKQYVYRVHNAPVSSPFFDGLCWRVSPPLALVPMQTAAAAVVGRHDFASFMSGGSKITDTVRTVHRFTVQRQGEYLLFTICADGYLYNMVRILVGTLTEVGTGRLPAQAMPQIIAARRRSAAGPKAPPQGLYLERVFYDLDGFRQTDTAEALPMLP